MKYPWSRTKVNILKGQILEIISTDVKGQNNTNCYKLKKKKKSLEKKFQLWHTQAVWSWLFLCALTGHDSCCLNGIYQPEIAWAFPSRHRQMNLLGLTWTRKNINSFEVHFPHCDITEVQQNSTLKLWSKNVKGTEPIDPEEGRGQCLQMIKQSWQAWQQRHEGLCQCLPDLVRWYKWLLFLSLNLSCIPHCFPGGN